jgi:hypothetical protein
MELSRQLEPWAIRNKENAMAVSKKKIRAAAGLSKEQQLLAYARQVADQGADWIELHNAVFGIGGKFSRLFATRPERTRFLKSPEYKEIARMIAKLQGGNDDTPFEEILTNVNGRLLVRVPRSIHAALLAEAAAEGISLNQLCLAKLSVQLQTAVR